MRPRPTPRQLHARILPWYRRRGRNLPWRKTQDPYAVLVSEVMLQQTQVNRVLLKFPDFMMLFPAVHRLAAASRREVVTAWRGMGYNNRAVRLHQLAQMVVARHGGSIPGSLAELRALPGIGRYSAHAVLAFAFRKPVPVVDINVRRVLSRMLWRVVETKALHAEEEIWEVAGAYLPRRSAYDWNQALMDLGATVCTARAPRCGDCPVSRRCLSAGRLVRSGSGRKRTGPGRNGLPNRVYRGRIVEALRSRTGGVTLPRLGRLITDDYRPSDLRWLSQLVGALAGDGLVRLTGRSGAHQRVTLA